MSRRLLLLGESEEGAKRLQECLPHAEGFTRCSDVDEALNWAMNHMPAGILVNGDDPAALEVCTLFRREKRLSNLPLAVFHSSPVRPRLIEHCFLNSSRSACRRVLEGALWKTSPSSLIVLSFRSAPHRVQTVGRGLSSPGGRRVLVSHRQNPNFMPTCRPHPKSMKRIRIVSMHWKWPRSRTVARNGRGGARFSGGVRGLSSQSGDTEGRA